VSKPYAVPFTFYEGHAAVGKNKNRETVTVTQPDVQVGSDARLMSANPPSTADAPQNTTSDASSTSEGEKDAAAPKSLLAPLEGFGERQGSIIETPSAPTPAPQPALSSTIVILVSRLEQYAENMAAGKPVPVEKGAQYQKQLMDIILLTLKLPDSDFYIAWEELLKVIHRFRNGAFHEGRVFRFLAAMPLEDKQRRYFKNLVSLMINTADPAGRRVALKTINLEAAAHGVPVAQVSERLTAFYAPR
jgi:hypothetical protein